MHLLDVLLPGEERIRRPIRPVIEKIKDTLIQKTDVVDTASAQSDTLTTTPDATDTVTSAQHLACGLTSGGDSSSTLWTVILVGCALALCLYFAFAYRRRMASV